MSTTDAAKLLVIQDEWDGFIEDLIVRDIGRDDLPYDLVTDLDQARALLAHMSYSLILTEPFLAAGEEAEVGVLPLIEFCGERWPSTRILVISTAAPLPVDVMEQLDQSNVGGIYGKPLDSEAVTEIATLVEDVL